MMAVLLFLLALVPLAIWRAYVLTIVWGWFVVPLGVVDIGMAHALGISLVIAYLTHEFTQKDDDEFKDFVSRYVLLGTILPAFALGFGAIYHGFM